MDDKDRPSPFLQHDPFPFDPRPEAQEKPIGSLVMVSPRAAALRVCLRERERGG